MRFDMPQQQFGADPRAFIGDAEVGYNEFSWIPELPVAGDGSGAHVKHFDIRRAGWAAVQCSMDGVLRGIYGANSPDEPQLSGVAEHRALLQAADVAYRGHTRHEYHADCSSVVTAWQQGPTVAARAGKSYASLWRLWPGGDHPQAPGEHERGGVLSVSKVRAHQDKIEDPDFTNDAEYLAYLNQAADEYAAKGRKLHEINDADLRSYQGEANRAAAVVRAALETLAKGPPPGELPWRPRRAVSKGPAPARPVEATKHEFAECGTKAWRCQHCLRIIYSWQSPIRQEPCGRLPPSVQELQLHASTHMLRMCVIERGPEALVFCETCGAYASAKPRGLALPCPGAARGVVARRRVLDRIASGRHPRDGDARLLSASWPVQQGLARTGTAYSDGQGETFP